MIKWDRKYHDLCFPRDKIPCVEIEHCTGTEGEVLTRRFSLFRLLLLGWVSCTSLRAAWYQCRSENRIILAFILCLETTAVCTCCLGNRPICQTSTCISICWPVARLCHAMFYS